MAFSSEAKKAFKIGAVCVLTYYLNYFMRSLLSVYTPDMLENGFFTKENAALLSSTFMTVYAGGQLVNGYLGDHIRPGVMVPIGLALSGTALIAFPHCTPASLQVCCFALMGFGSSMLRGPLVRMISENSLPQYARISSVFLLVFSSAGPLTAGLCAALFRWRGAFVVSGCLSLLAALADLLLFARMERRGMIAAGTASSSRGRLDLFGVFRLPEFWRFLLLCIIIETAMHSIGFWIPTFLNEHLGYAPETAGVLYSVISLLKALSPFLCILMLRFFRDDCVVLIRWMYLLCAVLYAALFFIPSSRMNVMFLLPAQLLAGVSAACLWSVYVPSLGKSGKVSSANGTLDFVGYIGAAAANLVFAAMMEHVGWNGLLLVWALVFVLGVVITLLPGQRKRGA